MWNFIIDAGNTQIKLAVFNDSTLVITKRTSKLSFLADVKAILFDFPQIKSALLSSVITIESTVLAELKSIISLTELTIESPFPFTTIYKSVATLGKDRLALMTAGSVFYPNKNVLVIDAGSCITYDFLREDNSYLGGAISPGLHMRFQSLNAFTDRLPLITDINKVEQYIGNSTLGCINAGVFNGVVDEINGMIDRYFNEFKPLTIILTGGDSKYLQESIKKPIFAEPNFTLKGLNNLLTAIE